MNSKLFLKYFYCIAFAICLVQCRPDYFQDNVIEVNNEDLDAEIVCVVYSSHSNGLELKRNLTKPYVAAAAFKNTVNSTGWALLKVVTNGSYPDLLQAEAAGMAEGFVTAHFIMMYFQNWLAHYCHGEEEYCKRLDAFLDENIKWINFNIDSNPYSNYWYQVALIYKQLEGMYKGYVESKVEPKMTFLQFRYLQISGDLEDLELLLRKKVVHKTVGSGSCSALVKVFPKNADLAISHVTWNDYGSMLRIYKFYNFTFHNHDNGQVINGGVQSFSSYPGMVYSGDDFYILNSRLVTQETTIGNGNKDLMKYVKPNTLLEWVRTMIANRLAANGYEWCLIFEKHNSGTYNNQWMVLDYKLFKSGKPLQPNTLWILEQIPGTVNMADMSSLLDKQGYWASYNLPFFPYIYNISGVAESKKKYGSWFDYNLNPRAQIFHRDHTKVVDMETLVKLMRYNDFKSDPLSKCKACNPPYSAENAISARCDLNPANGTYPFGALRHRRHGGTDVKATNSLMSRRLSQFIAAGPTFDQQPAFQWSKTEWKKPLGHPDLFKFAPVLLDWSLEQWIVSPDI